MHLSVYVCVCVFMCICSLGHAVTKQFANIDWHKIILHSKFILKYHSYICHIFNYFTVPLHITIIHLSAYWKFIKPEGQKAEATIFVQFEYNQQFMEHLRTSHHIQQSQQIFSPERTQHLLLCVLAWLIVCLLECVTLSKPFGQNKFTL